MGVKGTQSDMRERPESRKSGPEWIVKQPPPEHHSLVAFDDSAMTQLWKIRNWAGFSLTQLWKILNWAGFALTQLWKISTELMPGFIVSTMDELQP
jgi:hypothetical protein